MKKNTDPVRLLETVSFSYKKEKELNLSEREVFVMSNNETHVSGIDLSKLPEAEKAALLGAAKELSNCISAVMSAWRLFEKAKMIIH